MGLRTDLQTQINIPATHAQLRKLALDFKSLNGVVLFLQLPHASPLPLPTTNLRNNQVSTDKHGGFWGEYFIIITIVVIVITIIIFHNISPRESEG